MARKKISKQEVRCEVCGRIFYRYSSQISKHNFCSQQEHVAYHANHPEESGVRLGKRGDAR